MKNQWENITLREFAQIRAVLKDEGRTAEDKMIALAAIVQGVDEDTILDMPLDEVRPVFEMAGGLLEPPKRSAIRKTYLVGRWELKLTETQDITVAQWVDFQSYGKDMEKHLVDILSVVLIPKGKKYNEGYNIEELKGDLDRLMSVPDALAVCFFFQRKWLKSIRRILTYLVGRTTMTGEKEARNKALELRKEVSAMLSSL